MFGEPSILDYYRKLQESARGDVLRESEEQIIGSDADELAQYFCSQYGLLPIVEDTEAEANFDIQDYLQDVPANRRENIYRGADALRNMPSQRAVVQVPILENKDLNTIAHLQGATHSMSYSDSDFNWGQNAISTTIETKGYQFELDTNQISNEINRALQRIRETIGWKNASIEQGNRELLVFLKGAINERRKKIAENKEKLAALTKIINIPLKAKPSAAAKIVRVEHKPLVQRIKPKPTLPEEYVVDVAKVNDVIKLLDNQARSFEQTPNAFKTLGEEDLRDILLSNLNSIFEGAATGETFSKNGKTDIYLKIAKGNILICECKIWGGKALYDATIDQLRGYLTWRQNYGIIITFVRNKDFTKTLKESETAIQAHISYLGGFKKVDETHFVSNHKVDDAEKKVEIHHLFYHLPA